MFVVNLGKINITIKGTFLGCLAKELTTTLLE